MSDMPEKAKQFIKEVKLYKKSLMALHRRMTQFEARLKLGTVLVRAGGIEVYDKNLVIKRLISILRGGLFYRPDKWIRNIARSKIPLNAQILARNIPKDDAWYKLHKKALDSLRYYLSNIAGTPGMIETYTNTIFSNLQARGAKGKFIQFLEAEAKKNNYSDYECR
jgi:hypothetical protein